MISVHYGRGDMVIREREREAAVPGFMATRKQIARARHNRIIYSTDGEEKDLSNVY